MSLWKWLTRDKADKTHSNNNHSQTLSEAEVFLAYGRKAEAIKLLENACKLHPERLDLIQKLEEIRR